MIDDPMERLASPVLTRLSIELDGKTCIARGTYTHGDPTILNVAAVGDPALDDVADADDVTLHLEVWAESGGSVLVVLITKLAQSLDRAEDILRHLLEELLHDLFWLPSPRTLPGADGAIGGHLVRTVFLTEPSDSPVLLWERAW